MRDAQLAHLIRVLKKGYIWALNIGENFKLSAQAWNTFAEELPSVPVPVPHYLHRRSCGLTLLAHICTTPLISKRMPLLLHSLGVNCGQEYPCDTHVRQRAALRRDY